MIYFVVRRIPHHAVHGGYERLVEFIEGSQNVNPLDIYPIIRGLVGNHLLNSIIRRVAGVSWYEVWALFAEIAVIRIALRKPGHIFHFIYGEEMFRFSAKWRRWLGADARLVCTFHQPPALFNEIVRSNDWLGELNAAVIVGNNQRNMLSSYIDGDRIFFVPLGVDTDFFCPGELDTPSAGNPTCITVGQWLRDFDTLRQVIGQINIDQVVVRFIVVTHPRNFIYFKDCLGVECKSGVDDSTLRELYRSSDVLLLPLQDCTANFGLLEGMACGLPVIITDVGGVRDYATETCAILMPLGDSGAIVSALTSLLAQPGRMKEMALHSRQRALQFSWEKVAFQMKEVYRVIL